jgi:hypothetical protein
MQTFKVVQLRTYEFASLQWRCSPNRAQAASFFILLTHIKIGHTHTHSSGRTSVNEGSASRQLTTTPEVTISTSHIHANVPRVRLAHYHL